MRRVGEPYEASDIRASTGGNDRGRSAGHRCKQMPIRKIRKREGGGNRSIGSPIRKVVEEVD